MRGGKNLVALLRFAWSTNSIRYNQLFQTSARNISSSLSVRSLCSSMEGEKMASDAQSSNTAQATVAEDYSKWTHSDLVKRVLELEKSMTSYALAQKSSIAPVFLVPILQSIYVLCSC